jgi:surface antigen
MVLALAVGLGSGYLAFDEAGVPADLRTHLAVAAFRQEADQARNRALEYELSGQTLRWRDPDMRAQVSVTPIRTYRTATGGFCREYREVRTFASHREIEQGLSCRVGNRRWIPRRIVIETAKPST